MTEAQKENRAKERAKGVYMYYARAKEKETERGTYISARVGLEVKRNAEHIHTFIQREQTGLKGGKAQSAKKKKGTPTT